MTDVRWSNTALLEAPDKRPLRALGNPWPDYGVHASVGRTAQDDPAGGDPTSNTP